MKEKIKREYFRTRKLLEIKLYSRNLIKGINNWVVLVRYSGQFLKSTREELKQMDQRTRKQIAIHKVLNHTDDVDRLYVSKKEGGKGLLLSLLLLFTPLEFFASVLADCFSLESE